MMKPVNGYCLGLSFWRDLVRARSVDEILSPIEELRWEEVVVDIGFPHPLSLGK